MRDIEGEKMWDGYLLNEQGKGRYPNRDKTIPYSDGGGDHDEANIDKLPSEMNPDQNNWSGEGYEELDYESIPVDELKQLSPEEAKKAIEKLSHADFVYQQHNFAFTDPEQRAKIDNVRGRLDVLRDVAKTPEQKEQDRVDAEAKAKADAEAKAKMYPHTDGRRPSMGEVQAKKKEFRSDGTFEQLGARLSPDSDARASKSSFAARSDGDGDLLGSVQSQVVMHWFRTGELPVLESLEIAMKAMNRL